MAVLKSRGERTTFRRAVCNLPEAVFKAIDAHFADKRFRTGSL